VPVWIDTSGYRTSPPLPQSEVASDADAAAAGAVVGLVIGCAAGAAGIRHLFNRRRMAAWEADWLVTAPAWNRQRW
jgi:Na+/glutamate symporter